jgi:hypothetical protein
VVNWDTPPSSRMEAARSSETSVALYRFFLDTSTAEDEDTITASKNRHHIFHRRELTFRKNVACMLRYCHLQNSRYVYKFLKFLLLSSVTNTNGEKYYSAPFARLVWANGVYTICVFSPCSPVEDHSFVNIFHMCNKYPAKKPRLTRHQILIF